MSPSAIDFSGVRLTSYASGSTVAPPSAIGAQSPAVAAPATLSVDALLHQLGSAAGGVASAFREFSSQTTPTLAISVLNRPAVAGSLSGVSARLNPIEGTRSLLATTLKINVQTSTDRASSGAIGLDLSTSPFKLASSALGLDVTSLAAASLLRSSAGLGLDLTSPDAASKLSSSQTLGVDVASAQRASVLGSSAGLGLDVTSAQSASTITSTAEMNTMPTSYGSPTLTFAGGTSVATLSGTYTGVNTAANASSLTVKIKTNVAALTSLVASHVKFEVRDQNNSVVFSFDGNIKAGDQVSLGADIGLSISFSAGSQRNSDTAATTVSHTPTDVDANAKFNDADPNLKPRFEGGLQVTAGSFSINGTSIAVNAGDSINDVIGRITASAAGVTASLVNDKITLTSKTNSEDDIVLSGDTSGFLAATKLSAATTVRGNISDDQQTLAKTSQFGAVANGAFTVNGVSISVNKSTDTLNSVISRINASAAGVTASYDSAQDKLLLTSNANSEDLITVGGDTSGFLTAAKLATGNTVLGNIRDDQQVLAKTSQFGAVTTGSFTINGVSIAVNKDTDTLAGLVSRITSSGAGVTASYDSVGDKLVLTGKSNSEDLITVGGDTSGFLGAAHLATANTVRGHLQEDQVVLADLSSFQSVGNGSFVVDGKTIAVDVGTDTIQSLVTKINQSGARATAGYDAATDKITLQATYNSEDNVPVGSDTSGFLAAAHLDAANTQKGNIRDDLQVLSKTSQFGGVASGSFTVNGQTIAVNRDADTVQTLIGKINGANAGVTASYDAATDKLTLAGTPTSDEVIAVAGDTTGFLAAAGLVSSNTTGKFADDQRALSKVSEYSGVSDGSFSVNGVSISVNANADTLQTVIGRINAAGAGVTASYDTNSDRLLFTPDVSGATLALDNDTSGFLAASHVATGDFGTHVNADAAFNATGLGAPLFDPGVSVQAGSFVVNGVSIAVAANDTINTVIDRITSSAAGVTASYDDTTQSVTLTTKDYSDAPIAVGGDTSGFLAAVKLDGTAASTTGRTTHQASATALGEMAEYAGVQAGTLTVNGHQIAIDPSTTTIAGLIGTINALEDVNASLDTRTGAIRIASQYGGRSVAISDTSGVLSAVGIAGGVYAGKPGNTTVTQTPTGTTVVTNAGSVSSSVAESIDALNNTLSQLSAVHDLAPGVSDQIEATIRRTVTALTDRGAEGISVTGHGTDVRVAIDRDKLAGTLSSDTVDAFGDAADAAQADLGALTALTASSAAAPVRDVVVAQLKNAVAAVRAQQAVSTLSLLPSPPHRAAGTTASKKPEKPGTGATLDHQASRATKAYESNKPADDDTSRRVDLQFSRTL